jgi:4-hydroxybenzoate polyprenyltransferase
MPGSIAGQIGRDFSDKGAEIHTRSAGAAVLALMRPHQWIKNVLVLAPLIFAQKLFDLRDVISAITAAVAFCAISSSAYALNDVIDRDADRAHPLKRYRPLARGDMRVSEALILALMLGATSIVLSASLGWTFVGIIALYVALQFAYSLALKDTVILDLIAVAVGFVLRAFAGGIAIHVEVSPWLIFVTFVLALFLVLARRRSELVAMGECGAVHRATLEMYTIRLVDHMVSITAGMTLLSYMIYTVSPEVAQKLHTTHLYLALPFAAYGVFRYLYLVVERDEGGDPASVLLSDRPLMVSVVLWIAMNIVLLYW